MKYKCVTYCNDLHILYFHDMVLFFFVASSSLERDGESSYSSGGSGGGSSSSSMLKTSQGGIDLAVEQCQGIVSQLAKNTLFGSTSV